MIALIFALYTTPAHHTVWEVYKQDFQSVQQCETYVSEHPEVLVENEALGYTCDELKEVSK